MDFKKYDDVMEIRDYNGFIDKLGNFYKVSHKKNIAEDDSHNLWAEAYMEDKKLLKGFKFNPTASAILTLTKLDGPASMLINCFGFVYYSHDPFYHLPIIKAPDPKIANFKITSEQIDTLFEMMLVNMENTDVLMDFEEGTILDYCGVDDRKCVKCKKIK